MHLTVGSDRPGVLRHDPHRVGYREGVANRFQFALPEPRPRDGWFRVGNLDITTTALLVIAGVASMFVYAISKETFSKLIFHPLDRKSTRLNSSHSQISYAVFCL